MGRFLLCCDTWEELQKLKNDCNMDYIIATSRYEFYKQVKTNKEEIIFMESDETIPYESTWNLLDQIHSIIDSENTFEYSRLFHFSYNIEGGFPIKIAQMIINLNFIHTIVHNYEIKGFFLFDNKDNWVINESIVLYAQSRQLVCRIFDGESGEEKTYLKTLAKMDAVKKNEEDDGLLLEEKKKIKDITGKESQIIQSSEIREEIGALYCCRYPYDKHVGWLMQRINIIGNDVKVICYYDTDDVNKFKNKGLKTDCLENYFILEDFLIGYHKLKDERSTILQLLEAKLHASYLDVDLSKFLIIKIRNNYYREVIDHLYMSVCAQNYFRHHFFDFVLMWGDTNSWETWLCYDNTKESDTKLFLIDWNSFIDCRVKQPYSDMISMAFVPNGQYNQFVKECHGRALLISDPLWDEKLKKECPVRTPDKKKRIAILPTGIVGGYTTHYFYYHTLMTVMEMLLSKGFEVVFKNHPGCSNECWEEDVRQCFEYNDNFQFMDSFQTVEAVLEQCYIVITDISSVAFDAAAARKPAFCIVDKQGYRLILQHERGFYIYQNLESMISKIERIVKDEDEYKEVIEQQTAYMAEWVSNCNIDMNGRIRRALYSIKKDKDSVGGKNRNK